MGRYKINKIHYKKNKREQHNIGIGSLLHLAESIESSQIRAAGARVSRVLFFHLETKLKDNKKFFCNQN